MKANKVGIIGKKLGMTQVYDNGAIAGVTVIDFSDMEIIGKRTTEKDGYNAVILGYDFKTVRRKEKEFKKPRYCREIRIEDSGVYDDDAKLSEAVSSIKKVDIAGIMKGRGFAGAIKRWHFNGGPATHGAKMHRRTGSIGMHTFPAHVFKGKHMPGHMGNTRVTVLGQKLVKFDAEKRLLFIRGNVPGANNGYVMVRDAIKA
ncbi:MAG: 50S ribosomal protein L3 [Spirochaetes bacterium GWF1_49_6]|jgi:large subunit ribosomal protein L3|nr:MAG: 50S ribosomal protein L3 [Spirochaetes bacterium GWF1_49_6]